MERFSMRVCCCICSILVSALAGCSGDNPGARVAELNKTNILKVANLYSAYQMQHSFAGPKDTAVLKQFVTNGDISQRRLDLMRIDPKNLDAIFVSERDGKPFKVKPSVQGSPF